MVRNESISILNLLLARNAKQTEPFKEIILCQNKLLDEVCVLKMKNVKLSLENQRLSEEKGSSPGGASGPQVHQLEQKMYKLHEELTDLHRRKGENAQQVINLNESLQEKDKEIKNYTTRCHELETMLAALRQEKKKIDNSCEEMQRTLTLVQDEFQAQQLTNNSLEEQVQRLSADNLELIQRLMMVKQQEADLYNDEMETFKKQKQIQVQNELVEAARETVNMEDNERLTIPVCVSVPNKVMHRFDAHDSEIFCVRWNHEGTTFATGSADRTVKLWRVGEGGVCQNINILRGSNQGVVAMDFDPADQLLIGASSDFATRVWSTQTGRLIHTFTGHSAKVNSAKFLNGSSKLVSGGHDRTLRILDLTSRVCSRTLFTSSICYDLVTSDLTPFSIISGHFDKRVRFWDYRNESSVNELLLQDRVVGLDISKDSKYLLSCTKDGTLKVIDLRMIQVLNTYTANSFRINTDWVYPCFSPDGQFVVVGSNDCNIYVWNTVKTKLEVVLKAEHKNTVVSVSWHPKGNMLVSCDRGNRCVLWEGFQ